jgi:hypothetical protein
MIPHLAKMRKRLLGALPQPLTSASVKLLPQTIAVNPSAILNAMGHDLSSEKPGNDRHGFPAIFLLHKMANALEPVNDCCHTRSSFSRNAMSFRPHRIRTCLSAIFSLCSHSPLSHPVEAMISLSRIQ